MALFEVPKRAGKGQDSVIAKKSKTKKSASTTIKSGNGVMGRIAEIKAMVEKNLGQYKDDYIVVDEKEMLHDYITECIGNGYISIDTETTGLDPLQDKIVGICPFTYGQKGAYIPLNHVSYVTGAKAPGQLDIDFVVDEFLRLLQKKPDIDMFNAKFDIRVLRSCGLRNIYCTWDGYLAARLLNENEPNKGLKALHKKYCLDGKGDAFSFDSLFNGITFDKIPIQTGYLYAAHDPVITTELCDYQRPFLTPSDAKCKEYELEGVAWVFHNIEMPCIPVVADMEDNGILFDMNYQKELSEKYNKLLEEKKQNFYKICDMYKKEIDRYKNSYTSNWKDTIEYKYAKGFGGEWDITEYETHKNDKVKGSVKLDDPINISSPTQLAILFYDILKCPVIDKKSPRGTGVDILSKMDNPLAKAILEYRAIEKQINTYIDKLPNCVNPKDGRIHCNFNQYGADTGRMSSSDPNLQNIPSHNKDIRKLFKAQDGYLLMSSDFSQQEPKCLAAMCKQAGDDQMYETFMQGKDLYSEIASKAFNVPYEECREFREDGTVNKAGKERRTQAKSILLGTLYGRGEKSIGEQLKCSTKKAKEIKESVFRGFPAIKKFEQDSLDMAYDLGYVTTVCGRKRRLPDLQLDEYEFRWKDGGSPSDDLLDFDFMNEPVVEEIPEETIEYYLHKLGKCWGKQKRGIFEEANREGIWIVDNGMKIADATRQCVNSRIQGSAADLTKLAMIELGKNERLKELGFRLLIPVHDEIIAECPEENIKECSELLASTMSRAAEQILEMPIKCDVAVTHEWYGEEVEI